MYQNELRYCMVFHDYGDDFGDVCIYSVRLHTIQTQEADIKLGSFTSGINNSLQL